MAEKYPSFEEVIAAHEMEFALGEWWEFYYDQLYVLKEHIGQGNYIPLISQEMCVTCGL